MYSNIWICQCLYTQVYSTFQQNLFNSNGFPSLLEYILYVTVNLKEAGSFYIILFFNISDRITKNYALI